MPNDGAIIHSNPFQTFKTPEILQGVGCLPLVINLGSNAFVFNMRLVKL